MSAKPAFGKHLSLNSASVDQFFNLCGESFAAEATAKTPVPGIKTYGLYVRIIANNLGNFDEVDIEVLNDGASKNFVAITSANGVGSVVKDENQYQLANLSSVVIHSSPTLISAGKTLEIEIQFSFL